MATLRELENRRELLEQELGAIRAEIRRRGPMRKHRCQNCKRMGERRSTNLFISMHVDRDGDWWEQDWFLQCPHCERWTRYYEKGAVQTLGDRDDYRSLDRGRESPWPWKNAALNRKHEKWT